MRKPDYTSFGLSTSMGPQLRKVVEKHLLADLNNYSQKEELKFDWSESCIEGKDTKYLDGSLENFSAIFLYDNNDNLVTEGWMEFVHSGDFFITYWKFLSVFEGGNEVIYKDQPGMPDHIWNLIPSDIQPLYKRERL